MKIFYSSRHQSHSPRYEIFNGKPDHHSEVPVRIENIRRSLVGAGYKISAASKEVPLPLVKRVHQKDYVEFLETGGGYTYPSVFPYNKYPGKGNRIKNKLAQLGQYSFDLYTPVFEDTFDNALSSASLAYELATELKNGKTKVGYAMCRPPGHHAEPSKMGGYCYLNNSAIAAEYLSDEAKVAVLDVDFHHGNGTQAIFYERRDVLTVSIHAEPGWKFPFFSGFANEKGLGKGIGKNFNYPMPKGTTNAQYQRVLEKALKNILAFKPEYLVVALGLDTHCDDPIGGFLLTTDYYTKMAKSIRSLGLPTAIIQEGGYNTKLLGTNVVAFLDGFS